MLCELSKLGRPLPHEWLLGKWDDPGADIDMEMIVFDLQCVIAHGQEREAAQKKQRRKR